MPEEIYTLAEILADHLDAVKDGRVTAPGGGSVKFVSCKNSLRVSASFDTPLDGYTIEPELVEVRRRLPPAMKWDGVSSDTHLTTKQEHDAVLAFIDEFDKWRRKPIHVLEMMAARDRFKVVN